MDFALLQWTISISQNESNVSHKQLELYYQNIIMSSINKAWFYRGLGLVQSAERVLESVKELKEKLINSLNPDTLSICARYAIADGALSMDQSLYNNAIDKLIGAIKLLAEEQKLRYRKMNCFQINQLKIKQIYLIRRNVKYKFLFTFY